MRMPANKAFSLQSGTAQNGRDRIQVPVIARSWGFKSPPSPTRTFTPIAANLTRTGVRSYTNSALKQGASAPGTPRQPVGRAPRTRDRLSPGAHSLHWSPSQPMAYGCAPPVLVRGPSALDRLWRGGIRAEGSAVKGVADCRTDSMHRFPARGSNELRERRLGHRMEPVAVDGRFSVESVFSVVDRHLGCQTTHRACDLGDSDQCSDFEDVVACEDQHRSPFSSDLGKPDLSSVHSSPHASAPFQNWSGRSG